MPQRARFGRWPYEGGSWSQVRSATRAPLPESFSYGAPLSQRPHFASVSEFKPGCSH